MPPAHPQPENLPMWNSNPQVNPFHCWHFPHHRGHLEPTPSRKSFERTSQNYDIKRSALLATPTRGNQHTLDDTSDYIWHWCSGWLRLFSAQWGNSGLHWPVEQIVLKQYNIKTDDYINQVVYISVSVNLHDVTQMVRQRVFVPLLKVK